MAVCEEIRQSVEVDVPVTRANSTWTQFLVWNIYHRPLGRPDVSEAEPEAGYVHMEAIDDETTRVTVDLDYCAHVPTMSQSEEIATAQEHLRDTLAGYQRFIKSAVTTPSRGRSH